MWGGHCRPPGGLIQARFRGTGLAEKKCLPYIVPKIYSPLTLVAGPRVNIPFHEIRAPNH
jgi:hypothetical protein